MIWFKKFFLSGQLTAGSLECHACAWLWVCVHWWAGKARAQGWVLMGRSRPVMRSRCARIRSRAARDTAVAAGGVAAARRPHARVVEGQVVGMG